MACGALAVGGHLIGAQSMHAIVRPCQSLMRPHLAVLPRPTTSFINRAAKNCFRSVNLLVEAGSKKDKLKKHRKGGAKLTAHKALGQGGESVLNVSARLTPEEIWDREEARWEREEARWLREEQRWLKEESRWERERVQWSQEEAQLRNHIEALRASLAEAQLLADSRADAVRQTLEQESAQAQIIGQAALEAQLASDVQLASARAKWREEEQALLAEVDALKTALAEVLNEANAKAEAARRSWQKNEATLQAEIAQLKHSLLEAQAVTQARGSAKATKPTKDDRPPPKTQRQETKVAPTPSAEEIIAAVASRTLTPKPEVKSVFKSTISNGASSNGAPPKNQASPTPPKDAATTTPPKSGANPTPSRTLRYGAEGPDVRAVQTELESLGFYCGEEEMEADAYEDGTDSAVKSWQCSVGVREDGVLTPELQALLLGIAIEKGVPAEGQTGVSEAPILQQKDRKVESERYARTAAEGNAQGSARRVYLLGENRWEEPDRLVPANAKVIAAGMQKCFACKGEGKVLCTECEGTGDMNVEEQFLSWAGEDPHCPYCGGSGSTDCDSCEGTGVEAVLIR